MHEVVETFDRLQKRKVAVAVRRYNQLMNVCPVDKTDLHTELMNNSTNFLKHLWKDKTKEGTNYRCVLPKFCVKALIDWEHTNVMQQVGGSDFVCAGWLCEEGVNQTMCRRSQRHQKIRQTMCG